MRPASSNRWSSWGRHCGPRSTASRGRVLFAATVSVARPQNPLLSGRHAVNALRESRDLRGRDQRQEQRRSWRCRCSPRPAARPPPRRRARTGRRAVLDRGPVLAERGSWLLKVRPNCARHAARRPQSPLTADAPNCRPGAAGRCGQGLQLPRRWARRSAATDSGTAAAQEYMAAVGESWAMPTETRNTVEPEQNGVDMGGPTHNGVMCPPEEADDGGAQREGSQVGPGLVERVLHCGAPQACRRFDLQDEQREGDGRHAVSQGEQSGGGDVIVFLSANDSPGGRRPSVRHLLVARDSAPGRQPDGSRRRAHPIVAPGLPGTTSASARAPGSNCSMNGRSSSAHTSARKSTCSPGPVRARGTRPCPPAPGCG